MTLGFQFLSYKIRYGNWQFFELPAADIVQREVIIYPGWVGVDGKGVTEEAAAKLIEAANQCGFNTNIKPSKKLTLIREGARPLPPLEWLTAMLRDQLRHASQHDQMQAFEILKGPLGGAPGDPLKTIMRAHYEWEAGVTLWNCFSDPEQVSLHTGSGGMTHQMADGSPLARPTNPPVPAWEFMAYLLLQLLSTEHERMKVLEALEGA